MGRFGDAAVDFTHGASPANPTGSPSKHSKFLDSINQDQKGAAISGKPSFYENNTDGELKSFWVKTESGSRSYIPTSATIKSEHLLELAAS